MNHTAFREFCDDGCRQGKPLRSSAKNENGLRLAFVDGLGRELGLLNTCQEAEVSGIVRPVLAELEWIDVEGNPECSVAALLMPFLAGGDLVQLIGQQASRSGRLGPTLAQLFGDAEVGIAGKVARGDDRVSR